jgi:cytochrome c-type biogenesis protein CcmH
VGPRLNFSTAWSSNAVSIFKSCGLGKVSRAECSRRFRLRTASGAPFALTPAQTAAFAAEVHDRMTECVYTAPLSSFNSNVTPKPVTTIPVMAKGRAALEAINKARERLNMPALDPDTVVAQAPPSPAPTAKPTQGKTAPGAERIAGRVSLDPGLASQVSPQDTVFIYANAADGPRIPLAIVRTTVDKLPYDFVLDDSMAMNPQMKLSHISAVMVRARISRSGNAMAQPGDLGVSAGPIKPGSKEKINLVIAQPLSK